MSKPEQAKKPKGIRRWLKRPETRPIRSMVKQESAGGIIFRRNPNGVEILMIEDGKGRWSVPKGKIDVGEKSHDTVVREIQEETGLKHLRVLDWLGKVNFQYRHTDTLIMKTMQVFLVESRDQGNDFAPAKRSSADSEIIKSVKWFPISEALDLIEYEDISKLMLIALKKIRNGQ